MENFMTIDEAVKLYGESVFGENNDTSEAIESFPVKDRTSKSSRRKKTYFKGKKRYDRVYQKGFTPFPNKESVIRGMMRNTRQKGFNHSVIRSLNSVDNKMLDYYKEAV